MNEIQSINLTNGVNEKMEGFVTISIICDNREFAVGQMSPNDIRKMVLDWLEAAEAADQDAATFRTIRKLGLQDELAGMIITELRNSREKDE